MREIKFRAWTYWRNAISGKKYKMIHSGDITEKSKCRAVDFPFGIDGKFVLDIMQYTGLKDKNNKEIYEGDILKGIETKAGVVKYKYGMFVVDDKTLCRGDVAIYCSGQYYEVIGNIYENPELLEGE